MVSLVTRGWIVGLYFLSSLSTLHAEWHEQTFDVMGTRAKVELWHEDALQAQKYIELTIKEMRRIDDLMSSYKPSSELSQINREAAKKSLIISKELWQLINQSIEFSKLTHGAFDITYASVGYLYHYRDKRAPSHETVQQKKALIDYRAIQLDQATSSIRFDRKGVKIDLGGIAKGYAVDRCIELLNRAGIQHAFVRAGGDSRVLGDKRGRLWRIGIPQPRNKDKLITQLPLENSAISTSGDYERFFIAADQRIHHIIDPKTGHSANKSVSVSIIADNALTSDALSTAVFVLGPKSGLQLINQLDQTSAIIIDAKGKFHYTNDLSPH